MVEQTPASDRVSRRRFVKAVGTSGAAAGIAGCSGGRTNGSGGGEDTGTDAGDGGSGGGGKTVVQFAADSRAADAQDAINAGLHDAGLDENIEIEVLAGSQVTDNRQQQYNQWLSANRSEPSLLMMDSGWTIPFIVREQVANLEDELPQSLIEEVKENYFGASVATAQDPNGALHGVPLFPDFPTVQYRKDLFREAGFSDSDFDRWATESMSWKEFSNAVKKVKTETGTKHGFTFQADVYEGLSCCDFNEWLTSWGGAYFGAHENLFGPIGDRPITVDEQPVIDSLRMIRTFIHGSDDPEALDGYAGGIAPNAVLQWTEETSRKPFTAGDVVAHRNWPYSININGAEDKFGTDLGVMPIPWGVESSEAKYEGTGGPVAALGGWHVTLNPNAAKKDAALKVIEAMTKESFQLTMFGEIGWIPPRPTLLNSEEATKVPVIGRYVDQLKVAGENAVPRPVTAVWPQESNKISQQANAALSQDKTPAKAMSELKSQLQSIEESV